MSKSDAVSFFNFCCRTYAGQNFIFTPDVCEAYSGMNCHYDNKDKTFVVTDLNGIVIHTSRALDPYWV